MRRALLLVIGIAILWVPAVSVAGDSSPSLSSKKAAKTETPHRKSDASNAATTCGSRRNSPNFAASHNGKGRGTGANAFGKCVATNATHKVKGHGKDSAEGRHNDAAESDGKDATESDGKDSAKSDGKDSAGTQGKNSANPGMTCRAMQANDFAHFQTAYGTRPNAFGKCVAKQAKSN
jgi:hypothetical protein